MSRIIDAALLFPGLFLGIFWFSLVLLPVFCGVPRATWWALRGLVRWRVIPLYLIAPIIWFLIFVGAEFLLYHFLPNIFWHLSSSATFNLGQLIGVGICVLRAIGTRSGRSDLNYDFFHFVRRYLTPAGMRTLEERGVALDAANAVPARKAQVWSLIYLIMYWLKRVFGFLTAALVLAFPVVLILAIFGWAPWAWLWYVLGAAIMSFILRGLVLMSGFIVAPRMLREQEDSE